MANKAEFHPSLPHRGAFRVLAGLLALWGGSTVATFVPGSTAFQLGAGSFAALAIGTLLAWVRAREVVRVEQGGEIRWRRHSVPVSRARCVQVRVHRVLRRGSHRTGLCDVYEALYGVWIVGPDLEVQLLRPAANLPRAQRLATEAAAFLELPWEQVEPGPPPDSSRRPREPRSTPTQWARSRGREP